jgi:hypothetical protein
MAKKILKFYAQKIIVVCFKSPNAAPEKKKLKKDRKTGEFWPHKEIYRKNALSSNTISMRNCPPAPGIFVRSLYTHSYV